MVCNKEQVLLVKHENNNYKIIFNAHNSKFPIRAIVGLKIYTLLYELNHDIIHSFKVIKEDDTKIETLTLFKSLGKDFGISPKFMHTTSVMKMGAESESGSGVGVCTFNSVDVELNNSDGTGTGKNVFQMIPKKYERIHTTHSELVVYFLSDHDLRVEFTFNLNDDDDVSNEGNNSSCPIYMENSIALMIKKMFCRLKVFTERMS